MIEKQIAILSGDGPGPDLLREPIRILQSLEKQLNLKFEFHYELIGNASLEITGETLPREAVRLCKNADAVMVGYIGNPDAVGGKKKLINTQAPLQRLRKAMTSFCDVKPFYFLEGMQDFSSLKVNKLEALDLLVFRESSAGFAPGESGRDKQKTTAFDCMVYSQKDIYRTGKLAYKAALSRRQKISLVDKSEILETSRLWREVISGLSTEYAEVQTEFLTLDQFFCQLFREPASFDVILCDSFLGDLINAQLSSISGLNGAIPLASYGINNGIFHCLPVQVESHANLLSAILSVPMMLDFFEQNEAASKIRLLVSEALSRNLLNLKNLPGSTTSNNPYLAGDFIINELNSQSA